MCRPASRHVDLYDKLHSSAHYSWDARKCVLRLIQQAAHKAHLLVQPARLLQPPYGRRRCIRCAAAVLPREPSYCNGLWQGLFLYLPTGQLVMCGWSQASPPRTSPIWSIFCQRPLSSLPPSPRQHSVHVIYQSLPSLIHKARSRAPEMTATAGGLHNSFPSPSPPQHVGRPGHRALDGRSHVTVWGPQTFGGGCSRCKQALTAALTNSAHICGKVRLFISAKTLQQPGDSAEMKRAGGVEKKKRKKEKQPKELTWKRKQNNPLSDNTITEWAVNFHVNRTPFERRCVISLSSPKVAVSKQWQKVNERWMQIYPDTSRWNGGWRWSEGISSQFVQVVDIFINMLGFFSVWQKTEF